jgi:DNA modification methylase
MYQLFNGDCLDIMPTLPAQSVDAIITDLPYGTTACAWDSVIPFDEMWTCVKHVLKPNGAFVTTASQPFTSLLVCSNLAWFRYEWIWEKAKASNFLLAKKHPLKSHENILVFYQEPTCYNFQPRLLSESGKARNNRNNFTDIKNLGSVYSDCILKRLEYKGKTHGYPHSILKFTQESNNQFKKPVTHPTQKPVVLYEYLIRTYTNPGDVVLDMCFGSNTTGVACIETGRKYIGIEKDRKYFEIGQRRIEQAQPPLFVETGSPANNRLHTTGKGGEQNWLFN